MEKVEPPRNPKIEQVRINDLRSMNTEEEWIYPYFRFMDEMWKFLFE